MNKEKSILGYIKVCFILNWNLTEWLEQIIHFLNSIQYLADYWNNF